MKKDPNDYIGTLINMKLDGDVLTIKLRLTPEEVKAYKPAAGKIPRPITVSPILRNEPTLDALIAERSKRG